MISLKKIKNQALKYRLRLIFVAIFLLLLALFLCFKFVPGGKISFSSNFSKSINLGRGFFADFRPGERIDFSQKESLVIISDPVYFSILSPRTFSKAKITIEYHDKLSSETPIVELGVLKDLSSQAYELKPIQNKILDKLRFSWKRLVDENALLVLQKEEIYNSSEKFFSDLDKNYLENCSTEALNCVAFYNHSLKRDYKLPAYTQTFPLTIRQALRGSHQFQVYFKDSKDNLKINFRNLNLDNLPGNINVRLYFQDELISSQILELKKDNFSGLSFDNNFRQGELIDELIFNDFFKEEGLYKFEIIANNNIVIEEIESSSDRLVFINKVWPVYELVYGDFWSNASSLNFKTFNTESLSKVKIDDEVIDISKTYKNFSGEVDNLLDLKNIKLEKSDIIIETRGFISINKDKFFNSEPRKIDRLFSPEKESFVVASYESPKNEDGLKTATVEFDLRGADFLNNKYSFVISIPGLEHDSGFGSELEYDNYLSIEKIKVEFSGKNILEKIKEIFKR